MVYRILCPLLFVTLSLMACGNSDTAPSTDRIPTSPGDDTVEGSATTDTHAVDDTHGATPDDSSAAEGGDGTPSPPDTSTSPEDAATPVTPDDVDDAATPSPAGDVDDAATPITPDGASGPDEDTASFPPEEVPWLDDPVWQCGNGVPISAIIDVILPEDPAGCPWNEGENLNDAQGTFTAHQVTAVAAELPGPAAAICAVNLESATFDPDYAQPFVYDDHFILLFNDVVLLGSYGDVIDALPSDRNLYLFDWSAIAGEPMDFNNNGAYCLGHGGDDPVECEIPAPESNGLVSYSVGGGIGTALSHRAVQQQRAEFTMVTFGDNDPDSDCRHGELRMRIVVDYVIAP